MKVAVVATVLGAVLGFGSAQAASVNMSGTLTSVSQGVVFGTAGPVDIGLDQHVQLTYRFNQPVSFSAGAFMFPDARHDIYKAGVGLISSFYADGAIIEQPEVDGVSEFVLDFLTPKSITTTGDLTEVITGGPWGLFATANLDANLGSFINYTITGSITDLPVGIPPIAVPEPRAWALAMMGLAAVGAQLRRRRHAPATPNAVA